MTECNTTTVDFTPLGRRQVVADFLGGRLTSDAGALLLREVDRRLGLLDAIDQAIPDPRDPRCTVHDQRAMLAQRILSLALDEGGTNARWIEHAVRGHESQRESSVVVRRDLCPAR